jgi:hypothetical protein
VAEDVETFTTKPVVELDINKMFEDEYKRVLRSLLEKFIHIAWGYLTGIANRATQLLEMDFYANISYTIEPDGVKFEIKYTIDPKSLEKLKKEVREKVEKKWVRIKLAEKYQKKQSIEVTT